MDVSKELELFKRYVSLYPGDNSAVVAISSIHLAQQLSEYINPSLDLGWIIRCVLDINSKNLFSKCRETEDSAVENHSNEPHPEHKFAKLIIRLSVLMLAIIYNESMTEEELDSHRLLPHSEFYYGPELSQLNSELIEMVSKLSPTEV